MQKVWLTILILLLIGCVTGIVFIGSLLGELCVRERIHVSNPLDQHLKFIYDPQKQRNLLWLLKRFHQICRHHHIPYWITGGTQLGATRHGGFIPHDDDIDVVVPEEYIEQLLPLLQTESDTHSVNRHSGSFYKWYREDCFIDIFPVRQNHEDFFEFVWLSNMVCPHQRWHISEVFPLQLTKFHNLRVNQPRNPEPYLVRTFGPKWDQELVITHVHRSSMLGALIQKKQKIELTPDVRRLIRVMNSHIRFSEL